ncbi:hypothetical protein EBU99_06455 [bacterium]|nr:hypothetical protein [bacterium]
MIEFRKKNISLRLVLFCTVWTSIFVATVSCRAKNTAVNSDPETVVMADAKWKSTSISVCWEFVSDATATFRNKIRETVNTAFKNTALRFSGWQVCPKIGQVNMRVFIYDDPGSKANPEFLALRASLREETPGHPRVRFRASQMSGQRAGIILSMTGEKAIPFFINMLNSLSPQGRMNLLVSSSLHEFGHAIGLRHEDAHPEALCPQFDEDMEAGDEKIGPWNKTSFMERCFYRNYDYEKGLVWPNELDIQGINTLYKK